MKYFRMKGQEDYPAVFLLARIQFSRLDNGGFQERMFSTSGNAMSNNQGSMEFDRLEKRTLRVHNKDLIRKKII